MTETLCGTGFSKSTVTRLAGELDTDLTAWRDRRLDDVAYPSMVIDARYEHVRIGGQVVSQGVLIVKGVRETGHRELLAVDVADTESEATHIELFLRLEERGLHGVQLVTSDDHRGLATMLRALPLRNAGGKVAYAAPSKSWALYLAADVARKHDPHHADLYRRLMIERGRRHDAHPKV